MVGKHCLEQLLLGLLELLGLDLLFLELNLQLADFLLEKLQGFDRA